MGTRRMTGSWISGLAFTLILGFATSAGAATQVLYDGALGGLPTDQGMVFSAFPPGAVLPTALGGSTRLDTTGSSTYMAGFGAISPLALNPTPGYSLEFTAQVLSESHSGNPARAGFSVIMIGQDATSSIEIGFQDGRVFSQNDAPLFGSPAADTNSLFNPVAMGMVDYRLTVVANAYTLLADDVVILSGQLRNYTGFGLPPYTVANTIFLGDNTSSAQANVNLSRVALVNPVPVPAAGYLFLTALVGLFFSKRH